MLVDCMLHILVLLARGKGNQVLVGCVPQRSSDSACLPCCSSLACLKVLHELLRLIASFWKQNSPWSGVLSLTATHSSRFNCQELLLCGMRGQSAAGGSSRQQQPFKGGSSAGQEFAVGSKVQCAATFDGQQHAADVLDIRTAPDGQKQYYVHFIGLDKRLDEWVPADKLSAPSTHVLARLESVPSLALPAELLTQADGQKITRRLKRKLEDSHAVPTHDDAADHHAPKTGLEKEHAERNKVKNVQVRSMHCAGCAVGGRPLGSCHGRHSQTWFQHSLQTWCSCGAGMVAAAGLCLGDGAGVVVWFLCSWFLCSEFLCSLLHAAYIYLACCCWQLQEQRGVSGSNGYTGSTSDAVDGSRQV
jgi:hypothetical protein